MGAWIARAVQPVFLLSITQKTFAHANEKLSTSKMDLSTSYQQPSKMKKLLILNVRASQTLSYPQKTQSLLLYIYNSFI
jgi:hypothetical protein